MVAIRFDSMLLNLMSYSELMKKKIQAIAQPFLAVMP